MSLNNQHAVRLREMAEPKECGNVVHWVESGFYDGIHLCDECRGTGVSVHPNAAALLAGAEALDRQRRDLDAIKAADAALNDLTVALAAEREKVEVAKAALLQITCGCHPADSDVTRGTCATADAALARLEGK